MIPARLRWLTAALAVLAVIAGGAAARAADDQDVRLQRAVKEGQQACAAQDWEKALAIFKEADAATPGADSAWKVTLLIHLARVYLQFGQYQDAEPCYARGVQICGRCYEQAGAQDRDALGLLLSIVLKSQGYCADLLGHYVQAEKCLRKCLELARAHRKSGDPFIEQTLTQLGSLYREMGRYEEAEDRLREALRLCAPGSADRAAALNELGQLHFQEGWAQAAKRGQLLRDAERELRESRQALEADPKADVLLLGACLNNLAWLYQAEARVGEAEEAYRRCLDLLTANLGKDHPRVAKAESNLGWLCFQTGRYEQARQHFERSLEIRERRMAATNPDHPELAFARLNLAVLDARQGRWAQAVAAMDKAHHSLARYQRAVLPFLSEPEQLAFLRPQREDVYRSLALGPAAAAGAADLSAEWALNSKGVAVEAASLRSLLARDRDHARVRDLAAVHTRLANLALQVPAAGAAEAWREQIAELERREQDLVRGLGDDVAGLLQKDPWVDLAEVRSALAPDAVLVEISKFDAGVLHPAPGHGQEQDLHYAAWVVPAQGQGRVRVVDLGTVDRIDAAVAAVRRAIAQAPKEIKRLREREAEKEFRGVLQPLADLLLKPLQEQAGLDQKARWIISPDGDLWLLPWEMLPLPENRYAVEDHQISYVVSGRDLDPRQARLRRGAAAPGPAVVMAHPDYDLARPGTGLARRGGEDRTRGEGDPRTVRGFRGAYFEELEGSLEEVDRVVPRLLRLTGRKPELYTDEAATERAFCSLRSPRFLVLSTHGFTLAEDPGAPAVDPLYLCGLAFAGANHRNEVADPDQDNGIVTGKKIVGTDLRGTELVVLSACDSGIGTVNDGEGVASLRQAFHLAGARTVVGTLWEISDQETPKIMDAFFAGLARGGKAEALRAAQRARIEVRRKQFGGAHPFYWAAFTLTGEAE